jgi:putative transposase
MRPRKDEREIRKVLAEVAQWQARGLKLTEACRKVGIAGSTYYRWKQGAGPPKTVEERKAADLERQISRLKTLVADQALDIVMLREIAKGKF